MARTEIQRRRGSLLTVLLLIAGGIALAVVTQEALAAQVGALLGGVWAYVIVLIAGLLGAVVGGG